MKKFGVVSYNIYGNFTNYGSALQSWALCKTIDKLGQGKWISCLVDYCPDILANLDQLNPFENMWDKDEETKKLCALSKHAIKDNYNKFAIFYNTKFNKTLKRYTSENFDDIVKNESIDGFVCGSDTIFCMDEFGFDDGFYANYSCMINNSVAYAASFGDPSLSIENCLKLNSRLKNFKAIGLRENMMISYVNNHTDVSVKRVIDPTLLLTSEEYDKIAVNHRLEKDKYILYYSRRYSPVMEEYVVKLAHEKKYKIIEISLRATNIEKGHRMFYEAGVEEFLSLVKNAEFVVTNSFHGMIFAVQYRKTFVIFSREQCNNKICEILNLFGLSNRIMVNGNENVEEQIDYDVVHKRIEKARIDSIEFLVQELKLL